jgi:hypothetical protein
MAKYKVIYYYPDGTSEEDDELFDTEEEAKEHGLYMCDCYRVGGEVLNMSNPGDYPLTDDECDYEVVKV